MPSSQDAQSQPKRPQMLARHSSTSSQVSHSPSDSHTTQLRAGPHKAQKHVVGHGRMGSRNPSVGKNLHKLNKLTPAHPPPTSGDGTPTQAKNHHRSSSGNATPATSPRPSFKRHASAAVISKNNTTHTVLKKNHSSGHLPRQASSKNMLKSTKSEVAPKNKSLAYPGKSRNSLPDDAVLPTVRFDMGDETDEDGEDAWTEESTSQSPNTTRSNSRANTRSNSVVLEQPDNQSQQAEDHAPGQHAHVKDKWSEQHPITSPLARQEPQSAYGEQHVNGSTTHRQPSSRPPDADVITSKLLQRSQNAPPQTSQVMATIMSDSNNPKSLTHSSESTLAETPGKDLVSRFIGSEGGSASNTPRNSSFLPPPEGRKPGELGAEQRNKSAPNLADRSGGSPGSHSERPTSGSGSSTPGAPKDNLSRTQQKLWLQRASSEIEPQKLVPAILPRTGAPQILGAGVNYATVGEGRTDPRLQRLFDQANLEYGVIRRYRNPLADALARTEARKRTSPSKALTPGLKNGYVAGVGGDGAMRDPPRPSRPGIVDDVTPHSRRSRVSFEGVPEEDEDEPAMVASRSFGSDAGRARNEVEELCRRLWERSEIAEAD